MAKQARVRVAGCMYHVCSRGDHRGELFCHEVDVSHFLGLLEDAFDESALTGLKWGLVLGGERFGRTVLRHLQIGMETRGGKPQAC